MVVLFITMSSCASIKYGDNDGVVIFSNSTNIEESASLLGIEVEHQRIDIDECMLVNDFDPQKANISMLSYPDIFEKQYDKYFKRTGKYDFYLHPILCDGKAIDIKSNADIVVYDIADKNVKKLWGKDILTRKEKKGILTSFARLDNEKNILYVVASNGYIFALDLNNKNVIWKKHFNSGFMSSPSIGDDKLFLVSTSDELYAININNGDVEWKIKQEEEQNMTKSLQIAPVLIYKDNIVAGFSNGEIAMVKQNNGVVVWKSKISSYQGNTNTTDINDIDFPPVIFFDKVLVAGGIGTSVIGFNIKNGQPIWQIPTALNSYILQNDQGFGFFIDKDNNNICFNGMNGEIKTIKSNGSGVGVEKMPGYFNEGNNTYTWRINRYYDAYFE